MASASATSDSKQSSQRRKSNETVCSSNSSCFLHKRKQTHPLAASIRTYIPKNNATNAVKQRVLSARLLKLRSLQNQLNDANYHLAELQQENRALKHLQGRQDRALSRYEGANADLPRLLKAHEEEMRVIMAKNKTLRKNLKEVSDQLKIKEEELACVREQLKNITALSKQKNLGERQALAEQVEDLREKLKCSDDKVNLLNRKIQLEMKNYRYKLNTEIGKNKQTHKELLHALSEIDRLTGQVEGKCKFTSSGPISRKRFANAPMIARQSVSLVNLIDEKPDKETNNVEEAIAEQPKVAVSFSINDEVIFPNDKDNDNQISDRSDLKLESILTEKDSKSGSLDSSAMPSPVDSVKIREKTDSRPTTVNNGVLVSPTENIKARLSSRTGGLNFRNNDIDQVARNLDRLSLLDRENSLPETSTYLMNKQRSRPSSSHKLVKLPSSSNLEGLLHKPIQKEDQELNHCFGSLCTDMMTTVKSCGGVADRHKDDYESAKNETEKLLRSLRETDSLNSKLKYSKFLATETFEFPEQDLDLVNQIWKDEYNFRKNSVGSSSKEDVKEYESFVKSDRNSNVVQKEVEVALEDKTKLLATLRAIDNGEEIEEIKYI